MSETLTTEIRNNLEIKGLINEMRKTLDGMYSRLEGEERINDQRRVIERNQG